MRVCDICGKPILIYRLYEESYVDLKTETSGDLTEVGEFCRDCLNSIYDFIGHHRAQYLKEPEIETIDCVETKSATNKITTDTQTFINTRGEL